MLFSQKMVCNEIITLFIPYTSISYPQILYAFQSIEDVQYALHCCWERSFLLYIESVNRQHAQKRAKKTQCTYHLTIQNFQPTNLMPIRVGEATSCYSFLFHFIYISDGLKTVVSEKAFFNIFLIHLSLVFTKALWSWRSLLHCIVIFYIAKVNHDSLCFKTGG